MSYLVDPSQYETKHSKLQSAVIIGATTSNSTRIFVRMYRDGQWTLVISKNKIIGDLYRLGEASISNFLAANQIVPAYIDTFDFSDETDKTHVFDVAGLESETTYYYAVMTDDLSITRRTEIGSVSRKFFKTMKESPEKVVFGFYSCNDPIDGGGDGAWPAYYQQLVLNDADFSIGGGDQIYVDTNDKNEFPDIWLWLKKNKDDILKTYKNGKKYNKDGMRKYFIELYRLYYRVYWDIPKLKEVYERFPQYMIWDDHEIMDGWGSLTTNERIEKIKFRFNDSFSKADAKIIIDCMWEAACTAYNEYQHSHNPIGFPINNPLLPDTCQWDYHMEVGCSSFYFLDMRGHHDVEPSLKNANYKILGVDQFERFSEWLYKANANKNINNLFIICPVPLIHWREWIVNNLDIISSAKDDCMDEWDHDSNKKEKISLLNKIFSLNFGNNKRIIILSGDVHSASAFRIKSKDISSSSVFQITSSAISRKPCPEALSIGISTGGNISGSKKYYSEKLYGMCGSKNFSLITADKDQVVVSLHWPSGDNGELSTKVFYFK